MRGIFLACAIAALAAAGVDAPVSAQELQQAAPDREITELRDGLYQLRDGQQFTVFLVTPEGIVLADPLSRDTALWLRDELATRFPARPVRYVVQSHHHPERAEGASVFDDTAELVGHRLFDSALWDSRRDAPDRYRLVRNVESRYDSRRTITLGGLTAEAIYAGPVHSPETTVVLFPRQRIVFAVEPPPVHLAPFSFGSLRPRDVLQWLHAVAALEFDTMLLGSGETVARGDLVALADYLDELYTSVVTAYEQRRSIDQIRASAVLDAFKNAPHFAGRATQIARVYRALHLVRAEVSVSGIANYGPGRSAYCDAFAGCATGGVVPGGTAGAAILFGRGPGIVGELTFGPQSWSSRTAPSYQEEVALRRASAAILFRYGPLRPGRFSMAMLAGISQTVGDARGQVRSQRGTPARRWPT